MWSFPTHVARTRSVCWIHEWAVQNGWTNRDTVSEAYSCGPREPSSRWGSRSPTGTEFRENICSVGVRLRCDPMPDYFVHLSVVAAGSTRRTGRLTVCRLAVPVGPCRWPGRRSLSAASRSSTGPTATSSCRPSPPAHGTPRSPANSKWWSQPRRCVDAALLLYTRSVVCV